MSQQSDHLLDRIEASHLTIWQPEVVECTLGVQGDFIHLDHAYELFSALSRKYVDLHDPSLKVGIFGINGIPDKHNKTILQLSDRSKQRLRLRIQDVGIAYRLEHQSLIIGNYSVQLGEVSIGLLQPSPNLKARLITIKGAETGDGFLSSARSQLDRLNVHANIELDCHSDGRSKYKTIKVRGFTVVCFGLTVTNLSPIESLILQQEGIGGKRKMGCGMFTPVNREENDETQNYTTTGRSSSDNTSQCGNSRVSHDVSSVG